MTTPFTINMEHVGTATTTQFLTLRMSRFRHITQLTLQLPPNGVVLLDGPSGVGKTSLIDAISFALYDNMGNSCYHRADRNSRKKHDSTWVELTLPMYSFTDTPEDQATAVLTIYRQRRSNLLRVSGPGIELIDDSAQAYIDQVFGPYNTWLVGCYIRQEKPCGFFTMTSQEKLTLLQQLTLPSRYDHASGRMVSGSEQFDALLARTIEQINLISETVREAEIHTSFYAKIYMEKYNQLPNEIKAIQIWDEQTTKAYFEKYKVQDLQQLLVSVNQESRDSMQTIQKEISKEQIRQTQMQEAQKQYRQLQEMQKPLQTQLDELPAIQAEIKELEEKLSKVTEQIALAHKLEKEIAQEKLRLAQMQQTQKQYEQLEEMKKPLETELAELPPIQNEFKELEEALSEVVHQIALAQKSKRRKQLLTTKAELQRELDEIPSQTPTWTVQELEAFEKCLHGPSIEQLEAQLKQIPEAQTYLKQLQVYQAQQKLQTQVDQLREQLKSYPEESSQQQIDELGQKIWSRSLQEKKLTCPTCSSSLYLHQGQLTTIPEDAMENEHCSIHALCAEKETLQKKETLFHQRVRITQQLEEKEQAFEQFKEIADFDITQKPVLANYSLTQLDTLNTNLQKALNECMKVPDGIDVMVEKEKIAQQQKRTQLEESIHNIAVQISNLPAEDVPAEVTFLEKRKQELRNEIQHTHELKNKQKQLQSNLDQIQKQIKAIPLKLLQSCDCTIIEKLQEELGHADDSVVLKQKQQDLQQRIHQTQELQNKRSQLQSNVQQIQQQMEAIPSELLQADNLNILKELQEKLSNTHQQDELFKQEIGVQLQLYELQQLYQQHAASQQKYEKLNARLTSLHKIKATLITAEYIILDMFLSHVNQQLNEVLEPLFNEPINVTLSSLKQLKTDQRIKSQINYEITIAGTECTSINEISGGERSRISLAMAIVFSNFNRAPFLLLDESLSTLDAQIKETTMEIIRKYLHNKLVIAVNHDTTTGAYDSVFRLSK